MLPFLADEMDGWWLAKAVKFCVFMFRDAGSNPRVWMVELCMDFAIFILSAGPLLVKDDFWCVIWLRT